MLCNLIWASQFVLAKLVQEQMGPIFATLLPMAIATLCLMPLVRRQRRARDAAVAIRAPDIVSFGVIGVFGQVAAQLGITWGVGLAPASNAALLSLTLPIATALMAYLLLGERMTVVRWVSFVLAVAGVLQCSGVDWNDLKFTGGRVVTGNLLILVGVLGSAFYNVYSKKLLHRYTPLEVLLYSYYAVLICLIPLTLYLEPGSIRGMASYGPTVWLGIALLAALVFDQAFRGRDLRGHLGVEQAGSPRQVTMVGGIRSGKCVTSSFSGALRTAAGSFTTSVFGWMCSSR